MCSCTTLMATISTTNNIFTMLFVVIVQNCLLKIDFSAQGITLSISSLLNPLANEKLKMKIDSEIKKIQEQLAANDEAMNRFRKILELPEVEYKLESHEE